MNQWLYKATDTEIEEGHRRPDFETTRAFAVRDGILCRSPYNRANGHKANLVWRVRADDVIHLYYSQYNPTRAVHFAGSFRVLRPSADVRFDPECALAHVRDQNLVRRLVEAYQIPDGDVVTGWLVAPVSPSMEPDEDEEQLRKFLRGTNTLAGYEAAR
jgi:hypothetical protein